jgi:hypothetical protein
MREPDSGSLVQILLSGVLEVEPYRELNLTHCAAVFNVRDFTVIAALAINAGVTSVLLTKSVNRVVEHVEEIRSELRAEPLTDTELFNHRKVGVEASRPVESVPANIANLAASWKGKRSGFWLR